MCGFPAETDTPILKVNILLFLYYNYKLYWLQSMYLSPNGLIFSVLT